MSSPATGVYDKAGWQVNLGGTRRFARRQFRPGCLEHVNRVKLPDTITADERLVFMLIGEDKSSKQIAEALRCPVKTIHHRRLSLAKKLGKDRQRLIVAAVKYVWWLQHDTTEINNASYQI